MVPENTSIAHQDGTSPRKKPRLAADPNNKSPNTLIAKNTLFLENLSIRLPAYIPQKSMTNVVVAYMTPNSSGFPNILLKYHGIASMQMP
jgi:hypothetical protein